MITLPKNPMDLVGAYDDAADIIQKRAIVLGLALKLAEVVEKRAVIEACLLASILINCAAVAVIAGLVLHH